MTNPDQKRQWSTITGAVELTGLSRYHLSRLIDEGEAPWDRCVKMPSGVYRIPQSVIDDFLAAADGQAPTPNGETDGKSDAQVHGAD